MKLEYPNNVWIVKVPCPCGCGFPINEAVFLDKKKAQRFANKYLGKIEMRGLIV